MACRPMVHLAEGVGVFHAGVLGRGLGSLFPPATRKEKKKEIEERKCYKFPSPSSPLAARSMTSRKPKERSMRWKCSLARWYFSRAPEKRARMPAISASVFSSTSWITCSPLCTRAAISSAVGAPPPLVVLVLAGGRRTGVGACARLPPGVSPEGAPLMLLLLLLLALALLLLLLRGVLRFLAAALSGSDGSGWGNPGGMSCKKRKKERGKRKRPQ